MRDKVLVDVIIKIKPHTKGIIINVLQPHDASPAEPSPQEPAAVLQKCREGNTSVGFDDVAAGIGHGQGSPGERWCMEGEESKRLVHKRVSGVGQSEGDGEANSGPGGKDGGRGEGGCMVVGQWWLEGVGKGERKAKCDHRRLEEVSLEGELLMVQRE